MLSFRQAEKAEGNIYSSAKTIDGMNYTVTALESRKHMLGFLYKGHHKHAIEIFHKIATNGKIYSFENDHLPGWGDVPTLLSGYGK